ncbi:hypothetical protein WJX72_007452 [[Myrmecia] bisecta]|uniref:Acid phosphatase n=1 Tax=[Myrmecia] bisecta TaxID=41462 RepID=A0AAW1R7V7_9CHLO
MSKRGYLLATLGGSAAAAYWYNSSRRSAISSNDSGAASTSGSDQDNLKLVQVVFRHGARTPLTKNYWEGNQWESGSICGELPGALQLHLFNADGGGPRPDSKHDREQASRVLPGGCTQGELTLLGQKQSRELGEWLRQRYVEQQGFLPPVYQARAVGGRTTNFRRTISTIQGVLTGLYPGTAAAIPIGTAGDAEELLFPNSKSCDRLGQLMTVATDALKVQASQDPKMQQLEDRVRQAMSIPADAPVRFTDLHDAMTTLAFHGKPLPKGMTPDLLAATEAEATKRMAALVAPFRNTSDEQQLLRLSMGQLLQLIMERLDDAANGGPEAKMYMYSGHDTTIMPLVVALGVPLTKWPKYVSHVIYELWERPAIGRQQPQHYVKVLYNRQPLAIDGHKAGEAIPLETFKQQFLLPFAITKQQHAEQCRAKTDHEPPPTSNAGGDSVQGL